MREKQGREALKLYIVEGLCVLGGEGCAGGGKEL